LEVDPNVKPHWIIALQSVKANVLPAYAETLASLVLQNVLPSFAGQQGARWLEYISRQQWTYVLRPLLVSKQAYYAHAQALTGHDGSKMNAADLARLSCLPDYFWLAEFSLPSLYTGNRSKLGEVFVDAITPLNPANPTDLILGLRIPQFLVMKEVAGLQGAPCALESHAPIFMVKDHDHTW
jgi:hypothetical protein